MGYIQFKKYGRDRKPLFWKRIYIPSMKIDPEISKLFSELTGWNYEELKNDIRENGIKVPIIVGVVEGEDEETLVDGHQRLQIWTELGRDSDEIPKEIKGYPSREAMVRDAVVLNILRRHLTKGQRAYFAAKYLLPIEKEEAKKRQGSRTDLNFPANLQESEEEYTREAYTRAAKHVGLGGRTLRKAEEVFEKASEDIVKDVLTGKTSISHAHTKIKRREKHENPPPLPEGIFDVIYADPPWRYYLPLRGAPDAHYKTEALEDICDLDVPRADNAMLFLWTTNPHLEDAFEVIRAWGFTYVTNMVWEKDKWGTGYYLRGQHELLLFAKRGDMPVPLEEVRPSSVLRAPVSEHSRKPDEIYDLIETLYPNRRYLELYARPTDRREKWTYWGLEA